MSETKKTNKKTNKRTTVQQNDLEKQEYFGHAQDENIWDSFLVNKMIAHRGLHDKKVPENSLTAFKNAIEKGYCIELDINPIADGTPVVFHDSKMSRMTGKDKYIQNLDREEFDATTLSGSSEKIPTFEEVLSLVDGKVPLLIEIKHQEKVGQLEKSVWELLKNYKGEYAIQSFDPYTLNWFYKNAPKVWRGQLSCYFKGEKMNLIKKMILKHMSLKKVVQPNFVSYNIQDLPNRFTKRMDIPLITWVVRNYEDYLKALKHTDNIIFEDFEPDLY